MTREDCQVLQGICECVPDRTPLPPAELVSPFAVQVSMLVFLPLRFSCGPLSPATETSRRAQAAREKADCRDERQAFTDLAITFHLSAAYRRRRLIRASRCRP